MQSESLKCSVCLEDYDLNERLPKMLPHCGHTICTTCLLKILSHDCKCPFDKKEFDIYELNSFPTNFSLRSLIEENTEWDVCQVHGIRMEVVCMTDKCKVCPYCALFNGHKDHTLRPIMDIKADVSKKRKDLEEGLKVVDGCQKEMQTMLDEQKQELNNLIEEKFKELTANLNKKKGTLSLEVETFFNQEKTRLNLMLGNDSAFRLNYNYLIAKFRNFAKIQDPFSIMEENVDEIITKLDSLVFKKHVQDTNQKLQQIKTCLYDSLNISTNILDPLNAPNDILREKLNALTEENSKADIFAKMDVKLRSFEVKSCLRFDTSAGYLSITSSNEDPKSTIINIEDLEGIKEVRLAITKFRDEEKSVLNSIFSKLPEIVSFKVSAPNQTSTTSDYLVPICSNLKPEALQEVSLDFESSKIDEEGLMVFSNQILSKALNLKVLHLNFYKSNISDKVVQTLSRSIGTTLDLSKEFESLTINLGLTNITEESVVPMFVAMPSLKKLELSLRGTKVNDKVLGACVENTLKSATSLESLKMDLWMTKITDLSAAYLFSQLRELKSFNVNLVGTTITDKSVESFINTRLPTMKALKEFQLFLWKTQVSKETEAQLIQVVKEILA